MQAFRREGATILFVSHDLGTISALCGRALWLAGGTAAACGPAAEVVAAYTANGKRQEES
jgi:ABC-type polysaccharide/polyol phosphate transport system ATPase subunit